MVKIDEAQEKFLNKMNNRKAKHSVPDRYTLHSFVCKMSKWEALKIYNERV